MSFKIKWIKIHSFFIKTDKNQMTMYMCLFIFSQHFDKKQKKRN